MDRECNAVDTIVRRSIAFRVSICVCGASAPIGQDVPDKQDLVPLSYGEAHALRSCDCTSATTFFQEFPSLATSAALGSKNKKDKQLCLRVSQGHAFDPLTEFAICTSW